MKDKTNYVRTKSDYNLSFKHQVVPDVERGE